MQYSWVIFLILGSAVAVQISERVVGGQAAFADQFPWNVAIRFRNIFVCSGALISAEYILTTAECLKPYESNVYDVYVKLGSLDWVSGPGIPDYVGASIKLHPNYTRAADQKQSVERDIILRHNNIAVLGLNTNVTLSTAVQPIAMPQNQVNGGANVVLSGWGGKNSGIDAKLSFSRLSIMNIATCIELAGGAPSIDHDTNVCTAFFDPITGAAAGGCQWDHGAPLVQYNAAPLFNTVLVGLVSYANCDDLNYTPTIYSSINGHIDFIKSITGV